MARYTESVCTKTHSLITYREGERDSDGEGEWGRERAQSLLKGGSTVWERENNETQNERGLYSI